MKSAQLLKLQQQFLKSLHAGPTPWLLNEIEPAQGFSQSEDVLSVYLSRAACRTVDPLRQIYSTLKWLLGDQNFEQALSAFYTASLGEPLNAQALATEFAAFFGQLSDTQIEALLPASRVQAFPCNADQLIASAALLDWRLLWCSMAPPRKRASRDELLRTLQHRCHIWSRPRLERGSRLCTSLVDLTRLHQFSQEQRNNLNVPFCTQPSTFLIFSRDNHETSILKLEGLTERLLNHCDGTHTIGSLIHEQSFYGYSRNDVMHTIRSLIDDHIIVDLQSALLSP